MSKIHTNIEKYLVSSMNSKSLFIKLYIAISLKLAGVINSLISYPGGKYKMRKELNEVYEHLNKNTKYDILIDAFAGMGGSIKALEPSLIKSGVKKIIMNDINTCIITLHENLRNHKDSMIKDFHEIIKTRIIKKYKKLFLSVEEFGNVKSELKDEFYELQDKKEFGVKTSVRLILLSAFNFSGVVDIKNNGDIKFSSAIYDSKDIKDFLFNTISRIETFSKLYNQFEMEFYNEDYFNLFNKFKNQSQTLWNIDTVYVKEDYSEYIESDMEKLNNSDISECACAYGQKNFPHIEVLKTLENINFIYNNNTHSIVIYHRNKFNLYSKYFTRNEAINAKDGTEVKKVTEIILYKNNFSNKIEV